ncbi:MAG TPA: signal peptidase I [Actinomycetota bacterium]|nr:signal peptidase I [Actinomycetota bacterium]
MLAARRYLRGAVHLVLTVAVVASFAILLALGLGPRTGWYRTLTVLSGSMTPRIPVGSVVIVTPEAPSEVRVGQVITYQIPVLDHHVVSHRVVKVISGGGHPVLQTKGDANAAPDPWIFQVTDTRIWHVQGVVPGLGWMIIAVHQPWLHTASLYGIPALIAIVWIAHIWTTPSKREDRAAEGSRA